MYEQSNDASVSLNYLQIQYFSVLLHIFWHLTQKETQYS